MKVRQPSNALALAVGGLALAIATTGTAVAATGQLVNITDPVTAANKARVNVKGQLKVDTAPGQPARGWVSMYDSRDTNGRYAVVVAPTTATVALTDLTWAPYAGDDSRWSVGLYQANASTAEDCATGKYSSYRFLGRRTLQPATTLVENLTTPLVLAPSSPGTPWCLFLTAGTQTASPFGAVLSWTGSVLAGTLPTSPSTTGAVPRQNGDALEPDTASVTVAPQG